MSVQFTPINRKKPRSTQLKIQNVIFQCHWQVFPSHLHPPYHSWNSQIQATNVICVPGSKQPGAKNTLAFLIAEKTYRKIQVFLPIVVWSHPRNYPQTFRVESTFGFNLRKGTRQSASCCDSPSQHPNDHMSSLHLGEMQAVAGVQPKNTWQILAVSDLETRGHYHVRIHINLYIYIYILPTQTMHCYTVREIPQNYHRFVLFGSPKMGNLNDPCETRSYLNTSQEFAYPPRN